MLFAALILVSVDGEHDGLEQRINLRHGHQTAQMSNVPRLGLQEEQQVAVLLRLLVVRKAAFLQLGGFVEVVRDFVLLAA